MRALYGFIGMGNMGYALMSGLMKEEDKAELLFTDASPDRVKEIYETTGVRFTEQNSECANASKVVVLAVKPQVLPEVLKNIEFVLRPDHILVSIVAGVSSKDIQDLLGKDVRIVRAMPNTPCMIGKGMTGLAFDPEDVYTEEEEELVRKLFRSVGDVQDCAEKELGAVTVASGSSPAFFYIFAEALADAAVRAGMARAKAYDFVAHAMIGSGEMILKSGSHPGELKDRVCSPAGTTIEAVAELESAGFRSAVLRAGDACIKKYKELEKRDGQH